MSGSVNRVILIGNLGKDPEVSYTPSGVAVANFSIATSESWTDKNTGEKVERVEWHKIVCFNKLAELAGEYLHKGKQVYIDGKLQTRSWEGKDDGIKRYSTEIVVNNMVFLGAAGNGGKKAEAQAAAAGIAPPKMTSMPVPEEDDDIPF